METWLAGPDTQAPAANQIGSILNTWAAALVGMVYIHLPFMLFPLLLAHLGQSLLFDDLIEKLLRLRILRVLEQQLLDNLRWIRQAAENKLVVGSQARILYSDETGRRRIAEAFNRAVTAFQNALSHASASPEFAMGAHAGLASVYMSLGNWDQAVQEARLVDDDFEILTFYDYNDDSNVVYVETFQRPEMSAFQTYAGSFDPPDPRAPFTRCNETGTCANEIGADGETFHWRQEKYPDYGGDIPTLTGKESRLIEAEAALRASGPRAAGS